MKLFLTLLLLSLPVLAQAQFNFVTNDDNTITITSYTGSDSTIIIPSETNGYPVTGIGDGLADLGFGATTITVIIPDSVTSINDGAFLGCAQLANITIPNSVTNIGIDAFNSCFSLTHIQIPASVTQIGDYAFFYCNQLTNITVDPANPNYSSADGVLFNKDQTVLMQFPFGKSGSYAIPGTVTNLADEAFGINDFGFYDNFSSVYFGYGLTNLIVPGSLANLGAHAFSRCAGLKSVTLANGVSNIGTNAFSWCTNLACITIPNSVSNIDQLAFYYSGLTTVTIPGSVTNLGLGAFAVCSSLTNVTLQDGVMSIGTAGFNFCTNLTSITIPDSVNSIGERAFWFCTGMTNAILSSGVTNIGPYAFSGCASLININVEADNPDYSSIDGVLCDKSQTVLIQFPGGRSGSYRIPEPVTDIQDYAFAIYDPTGYSSYSYSLSNLNLTNLTVASTVATIGYYNFNGLANLTGVYFEGDAPEITGDFSYYNSVMFYYLPGTIGWNFFSQTTLWLPQMQTVGANFGGQTNQFGFNINWASGQTVVVEACTNFSNPNWQPVQTNTLTDGSAYFSDSQWTNYPNRFYRLRSP